MALKIVLPLDLDEESSWRKALPTAVDFARHNGAQLHVMDRCSRRAHRDDGGRPTHTGGLRTADRRGCAPAPWRVAEAPCARAT